MAWHHNSEFPDDRHFLSRDRNDLARFRFLLDQAQRCNRITAQQWLIGEVLLRFQRINGRCYPSAARIAQEARCCIRTVRYALARFAHYRLITWTRRVIRTAQGVRQTSSAFRLLLTPLAAFTSRRPKRQPGCSICTEARLIEESKRKPPVSETDQSRADHQAALATIRALRDPLVAAAWIARKTA